MKDAVRRLRNKLDGWESSLVLCMLVSAVSELRPKMLRRLSLDMPSKQMPLRRLAQRQRQDEGIGRLPRAGTSLCSRVGESERVAGR